MGVVMEEEIKRWTVRRKSALVDAEFGNGARVLVYRHEVAVTATSGRCACMILAGNEQVSGKQSVRGRPLPG